MNFTQLLPLAVVALAGIGVGMQPAFNGQLAGHLGSPLRAALVSFTAGALVLLAITAAVSLREGLPTGRQIASVPVHLWIIGGAIGALFVSSSAWTAPKLGVGAVLATVIAAQLVTALALDHFGLIGMEVRPVTLARLAGAALLIGGAVMVVRG